MFIIEEWRTVIYDGEVYEDYEVSSHGQVRSLNYNKTGKVQVLKPHIGKKGYLRIVLYKDGKRKRFLVHRVVAYTWIPNNDETKTEVNHINEDKTDNRVENLEWCDRNYNVHHGTGSERMGKAHSKRVLCVETGQIFESTYDVERKTGLNRSNVGSCCRGSLKTVGGFHWKYVS